jgi:hypothetical protein
MVLFLGHVLRLGMLLPVLVCGVTNAAAQTMTTQSGPQVGFTGGVSIDPEQAVVGVFWRSPELGGRFHIRPGVEGGFGNDIRLGTINIDFIARFPLGASRWDLVQGGGPSIVLRRLDAAGRRETDVGAGGSYVIGFAHESGFLGEFRIGGGNVPSLKIGAGWTIGF